MTPSPELAPWMEDALDAALDLVEMYPSAVAARVFDADALARPGVLRRTSPRDLVEVLIDESGVLVVATGREPRVTPYWAEVHMAPAFLDEDSPLHYVAVQAFRSLLLWHVKRGLDAVAGRLSPGAGLLGP